MVEPPPPVAMRSNPTEEWAYHAWRGKVYAVAPHSVLWLTCSPGSVDFDTPLHDVVGREITSREYADIQKAFLKIT